ncbi:MAG: efflux RND transporter permease subunit [Gammaproteobacteria bacterium]|nr:efflux RND transporter permease subunit [Gammaproteobacteria bacterium]
MQGPNLSEWALKHQSFVLYLILVSALFGLASYFKLGQAEDPSFTFRVMVVQAAWPGASAEEVERQLTDRIEKKLQELPGLDFLRSYSKPGESTVFVNLREDVDPKTVPDIWYQVRKKLQDIRGSLPQDVQGPFFNDEFGDTYGNIYAFTGDGFSHAELREYVEDIRQTLLHVPDVSKVDFVGLQAEKIYIESSDAKLATLGIDPALIINTLQNQNVMISAGDVSTETDRVFLRVSGDFKSVEHLKEIGIRAGGNTFRLGDIGKIYRAYSDPPTTRMRYRGEEAIGLAISMKAGGDIIELGRHLREAMDRIEADLPKGIDVHPVSDQPAVVKSSIGEFTRSLMEAVAIVLVVSLLSLGLRTGLVVVVSIPLVLAIVFVAMRMAGIDLNKISLGALIIALGLLVDDAIIAIEMMALKLEQGWDKVRAATFAYSSTAFPMLTGTLITVAGFLPVGLAKSAAGEYTFGIFAVTGIALVMSWFVAVVFIPYLGFHMLKAPDAAHQHDEHAVYDKPFYRRFRALVAWCVDHRKLVLVATTAAFALSIFSFRFVQQQFFPNSTRPEIVVDLWLPEGSSWKQTEAEAKKLEAYLAEQKEVENYTSYLGGGSPRFVLVLDQQLVNTNYSQTVILTRSTEEREALIRRLEERFPAEFPNARVRATRLPNGPPVGYPVQFRISGENPDTLRDLAEQMAAVMRQEPNAHNVNLDWNEKSKILKLEVDQNKARALGLSTQQLSFNLRTLLAGTPITQFREDNELIDIVARTEYANRNNVGRLQDLNIHIGNGRYVPLSQVAHVNYQAENGVIWRRNRLPTITVRADIPAHVQAPDVTNALWPKLQKIRDALPPGYVMEIGGAMESSIKSQNSINAVMPLMLVVVITLLMIQLQSLSRTFLVLLTAPLGLIGVTMALLLFHMPFGFVAMLGVIALAGMIMRNSVILVDQIDQDIAAGIAPYEAIIGSAVRRFRPIMLTALAAILAMIPLSRSVFWGPMAASIMGGLLVATVLTLLVLPALYAQWFRVKKT